MKNNSKLNIIIINYINFKTLWVMIKKSSMHYFKFKLGIKLVETFFFDNGSYFPLFVKCSKIDDFSYVIPEDSNITGSYNNLFVILQRKHSGIFDLFVIKVS